MRDRWCPTQDLDKQIVSIAESYTSSTVRSVMEPVLSFLAQVTAASRSAASAGDAAPPPALSTLPFAQPGSPPLPTRACRVVVRAFTVYVRLALAAKVKTLMATATATINEKLPPVASTLRLYHKGINFPSNRYNIILTLKVPLFTIITASGRPLTSSCLVIDYYAVVVVGFLSMVSSAGEHRGVCGAVLLGAQASRLRRGLHGRARDRAGRTHAVRRRHFLS